MFVLVAHFYIADALGDSIPSDALEPLDLLAASPDCLRLHFAHSTDSAEKFVLVAEFASAASYRRCISPWPMKTILIPWLSTAVTEGTEVSEVLYSVIDGEITAREPTVPRPGR